MTIDHDDAASLFEDLMLDAVDPLTIRLGGRDWLIEVPASDDVAALDDCASADDVLDELLGDDLADPVLDLLEAMPWSVTVDLAAEVREHFALVRPPPGGWGQLVRRIDRYGAAIEADLAHTYPGVELGQWFTGRRAWPQLYRLIEQLPTGSRWMAAVALDPDLARAQLDAEAEEDDDAAAERNRDTGPPLVGETYDRQLLRSAVSILGRIEHATYAVNAPRGKAGKPPRPLEGPRTARDELLTEAGMDEVYAIFAAVDETWRHPDEVGRTDSSGALAAGFHADHETGLWVPND